MSSIEEVRKRVAEVGKQAAITEEMIRLGFITAADIATGKLNQKEITDLIAELQPTVSELNQIQQRLTELGDIESRIKEIRAERILLSKQRREERKIEKERNRAIRREAWELQKRTQAPFLGVGVSNRLTFEGGDLTSLNKLGLPELNSLANIADAIGLNTEDLVWLCYERATSEFDHYTRFEIPKRSGGKRLISSPKPKMRQAQSWINLNILNQLKPSIYCYAFRPNTSIVDNAKQHMNKKVVIKLDIKDFFPSITFNRVRGYFEFLGYNPGVSTVLALLCTDAPRVRVTIKGRSQIVAVGARSLPQGACTSPAIANLTASRLDARLAGLIKTFNGDWSYTRYADDLTFSTSNPEPEIGKLIAAVNHISNDEKFVIKSEKTRIMRAPRRQSVTGLLVGDQVRIPKATIKNMRALFYNIESKGQEVVSEEIKKNALNVAHGYWAYLYMVNPKQADKYLKKHKWLAQ
jgi:retron-type reverse transcriptase